MHKNSQYVYSRKPILIQIEFDGKSVTKNNLKDDVKEE